MESGIPLTIRIRNPTKRLESEIQVQLTKAETQHLESGIRGVIRNPKKSEIQVQLTKAETQHLESGIRGVKTFIDCLTWGELLKRALA